MRLEQQACVAVQFMQYQGYELKRSSTSSEELGLT